MKQALKFAFAGFLFFLLSSISTVNAQRLYFCKSVSADGDPVGLNQYFTIPAEGMDIALLIKLPHTVEATEIQLKFYNVDSLNNETFESEVVFNVEKSWTWFWKGVDFHRTSMYKVYVYADKERLLCSETLYTRVQ